MAAVAAGLEYDSNSTDDRLQTTWSTTYDNTGPTAEFKIFNFFINVTSIGNINITYHWSKPAGADPFTRGTRLDFYAPNGSRIARNDTINANPFTLNLDTDVVGLHRIEAQAYVPSGDSFRVAIVTQYPYRFINDGHARFAGVAPETKLVGVKVFNQTGSGSSSDLITGLDWVYNNAETYHIVVASMGLDLNATVASVDAATSKLISKGISVLAAAGNQGQGGNYIYSPAHVDGVIAVAATNDFHTITSYSSQGPGHGNVTKPDLAGPGGQATQGGYLQADSNDGDANGGMDDWYSDDVTAIQGTSMAVSHTAGIAAILAQILGGSASWTYDSTTNSYKIKQIMMMTAWEVHGTDRGNKDNVEGYGEVQADAAIDALTSSLTIGTDVSYTLSNARYAPKVFARNVSLSASTAYTFNIAVPAGADFDLFLYDKDPNSNGEPVILQKSTTAATGGSELISYTPSVSGVYYLVVKQVSGSGMFTLDFHPPTISITSPANNTLTESDSILVSWTASDVGSGIDHYELFVNDASQGTTTETTLLTTLTAEGYNNVTVMVYDRANNTAQDTIWVLRDIFGPAISITSPTNETVTNQASITVEWVASDPTSGIANYTVYRNGTFVVTTTSTSWSVSLSGEGYYNITVVAFDNVGNSNYDTIWVIRDINDPTISISTANDTITDQASITVDWTGSDAGSRIDYYEVFVNGTSEGTTTDTSWLVALSAEGYYNITVVAYDNAGNSNRDFIWVARDINDPTITITSPANDTATNQGSVTVQWTGSDAGSRIDYYEVFVNDISIGTTTSLSMLVTLSTDLWYNITAVAYDRAGRSSQDTIWVQRDTVDPSISITSPVNDTATNQGSVTVDWSGSDAGSSIDYYEVFVNDVSQGTTTELSTSVSLSTDGYYNITVVAYDTAGNSNQDTIWVIRDTADPTISITSPANDTLTNQTIITVNWSGSDTGSGIDYYEVFVNSLSQGTITDLSMSVNLGTDGFHNITVVAYDRAGNTNHHTIWVQRDITNPTISITSPANDTVTNQGSVTVDWSGSDAGSGIDYYEVFLNDVSQGTTTSLSMVLNLSADGYYNITIVAHDIAENSNQDTIWVQRDTVDPTVSITSPANDTLTDQNTITVEWSGSDAESGIAYYEVFVNDVSQGTTTGSNMSVSLSVDGYYNITVVAYDGAGNIDQDTIWVQRDMTAPSISITSPANNTLTNQNSITVDWSGSDAESGIAYYEVFVNGTSQGTTTGLTMSVSLSADGYHNITVVAYDNAGNSNQDTIWVQRDMTDPTISITSPANDTATNQASITVDWSGSDTGSGIDYYEVFLNDVSQGTTTDLTMSVSLSADGYYNITVVAHDTAGNSNQDTIWVQRDMTDPTISITLPANDTITDQGSIIVNWTASDAGSGIDYYEVFVNGTSQGTTTDLNWTVTLSAEGYYNITVVAFDITGNSNRDLIWVIRDINDPTISITSPANDTATNQGSINVEWTGSDAGSRIDYYEVLVNGTSQGTTTGLSMTVNLNADGYHNITVVAYDRAGRSNQDTIWVQRDTVDPTVSITSPANDTLTNQNSVTVDWSGSDVGTGIDYYEVFLDDVSQGTTTGLTMSVNLGTDGYHNITVVAYDGTGNTDQDTIWVQRDMTDPTISITSPVNDTATIQGSITVDWSGSDAGSGIDYYEVFLNDVSQGTTASLSMGVTLSADGYYNITVVAHDIAGNSNKDTIWVIRDTADPTITITSPANDTLTNQNSVTVAWSGSDTGSGIDYYEVFLNDVSQGTTTSLTMSVNLGADGYHNITVVAYDRAGNTDQDTIWVQRDMTDPTITITSPANDTITDQGSITIDWSGSDGGSGINYYEVFRNGTSQGTTTDLNWTVTLSAEGYYNITVVAYDIAGNSNQDIIWVIRDTTDPTITITSPANETATNQASINVEWTGSDAGSRIDYYEVFLNDVSQGTTTSSNMLVALSADGDYNITLVAYDKAGKSNQDTIWVQRDTIDPTVSITSPTNDTLTQQTSITVDWSGSDADSGIAYYEVFVNGTSQGTTTSLTMSVSLSADGYHNITVVAYDNAGNSNQDTIWVLRDIDAPTITITSPANDTATNQGSLTVQWSGSDVGSGIDYYEVFLNDVSQGTTTSLSMGVTLSADGYYNITVVAYDNVGHSNRDTIWVQRDTVDPTISITSPANNTLTNQNSVTVDWSGTDTDSGIDYYEVFVNDVSQGTTTGLTMTVDLDADGYHNITVVAYDRAGNFDQDTIWVQRDMTDPTISITSPANETLTDQASITVDWSGSDAGSGIDYYEVFLNDVSQGTTTSLTMSVSLSADGYYNITVVAYDTAGNSNKDTIWVIRDTADPTITITSPANDTITNQASITVDWSGSDAGSGIDYYEVFVNGTSQGTTTSLTMSVSLSADGYHNITVVAYDNAGNSNKDTIWVIRDTVDPTVSITSPANDTITNQASITVDWSGSDAGSGIDYYEVFVNGTSQGTTTSLTMSVNLSADGYHNITVVAYDNAGNSNQDTIWVQRDMTDPTISITSPANDTLTNQGSITIDWSGSDAGSGIDYYEVFVNGTSQGTTTGLTMSVSLSADGYHNITVVAYDNAGNSNQDTIWVQRDMTDPTISITSPANDTITNQDNITVQWSGSDAESGIDYYEVFMDDVSQGTTTGLSMSVNLGTDGYHNITVVAYDTAGNSNQDTIWVQRDTVDPSITITSPANDSATIQGSVTVDWSGSDVGSGINYYEVFLNDVSQGTTTGLTMDVTLSADGYYNITVVAYDNAGNSNQDIIWVIRDTIDPTISITSPANDTITDQGSIIVNWTFNDAGSGIDYYEVFVNGTSQGTTTDLDWTVTLSAEGYYNITVVAYDRAGNSNRDFIWVARDIYDPIITITSPANDTITDQTSITVYWSGSDSGSGLAYYEVFVNDISQGTTSKWAPRQWTVTLSADGYYNIAVVAYDRAGNSNQDTIWVIRDINPPTITITSPANDTITDQTSISVEWSATDAGSGIDYYEVFVNELSRGTTTETNWIVALGADGYYNITIVAYDRAGRSDQDLIWVIRDIDAPTITITSPANDTATNQGSITVDWSGSDTGSGIDYYEVFLDDISQGTMTILSMVVTLSADGYHNITVVAYDQAGRSSQDTIWVQRDTVDPTISITSPANDTLTAQNSITIDWSGSDVDSGIDRYEVFLDDVSQGTTTEVSMVLNLGTDGYHNITVVAYDKAGNQNQATVWVQRDMTVPTITLTSPANDSATNQASITIDWSGSDAGSGIDYYDLYLNEVFYGTTTSMSMVVSLGADGYYNVTVIAYDSAGNSNSDTIWIERDTVDPTVSVTSPSNDTRTNQLSITIQWSGSDTDSGIDFYEVFVDDVSQGTTTGLSMSVSLSANGFHNVTVVAYDRAGNSAQDFIWVERDTVDPTITITSPANNTLTDQNSITIQWSGSDVGSGIAYYEVFLDDVSQGTTTGLSMSVSLSADGFHNITVIVYDMADNTDQATIWVQRDMTDPTITITSPANDTLTNQNSTTIQWTGSDAESGIDYYEIFVNGTSEGTTTGLSMSVDLDLDGNYNITVVAFDYAGNSNRDTIWIERDLTAPMVTITSPVNDTATNQHSITIQWTASSGGAAIDFYEVFVNGEFQGTVDSYIFNMTVSLGADNFYNITVVVHDLATNANRDTIWIQKDTVDPTISITSPADGTLTNQNSITVQWSASDAESGVAYYEVFVNGSSQGTTTGLSMIVSLSADGYHNITVVVHDNAGNSNQDTLWIQRDMTDPTISITSPANDIATNQSVITIVWTGTDGGSGIAYYEVFLNGVSQANLTSLTMLLPLSAEGSFNITVVAYDNAGNSNWDMIWVERDTVDPMITITSPANDTTTGQTSVTIEWSGSDADSGIAYYEVFVQVVGFLKVSQGTTSDTSWTVTLSGDGYYIITIKAYDYAGNTKEDRIWVQRDRTDPTISITSPSNNTRTSQASITIQWTGSDTRSGIDYYEVFVNGVSQGTTNDTSWTVTLSADGDYTITIIAYDMAGNTDQVTIRVTKFTSTTTTSTPPTTTPTPTTAPTPGFLLLPIISGLLVIGLFILFRRRKR
ncbi:MAG: Ig-like domain-containing protein [Promethearchaeota archaeon]